MQFGLGHMYFNGNGVPQDDVQALKWLNLAAATFTEKEGRKEKSRLSPQK